MDVLAGPYYFYCRTFLGPFGVWSLNSANTNRFLRFLSYVLGLTFFIPSLWKAYELRRHFYYFLLCMPSCAFYIQFYIKLTYSIYKNNQFRQLIEMVRNDFRSYTGKNLDILYQYARDATKVNRIYAYYLIGAVFVFNVPSFVPAILDILVPLNVSRSKGHPRLVKYNIQRFDGNFYLKALHAIILDIFAIFLIVGFDTLLLNCTQHSCALFRVVVREIKDIFERYNYKSTKGSKSLLYKDMSRVIELHKHALNFADYIESTYSTLQLLVTGMTLMTITLSEFETAINKAHPEIRFRFIIYGAGELLHILFHNYPGQRVKDHSLMIYQSCYESEWYRENVSNECKKLMNLMMLRSQKPCCLTGGGLYVLGLENYATMLKASLSYFTFLTSVL